MTTELTMLAPSIVLGLIQITIAAQASTRQRGADWNVGPRDEALPPLGGTAGRLDRALRNFLETFPLFAAAVLIAALSLAWSVATLGIILILVGADLGAGGRLSDLRHSGESWHPANNSSWPGLTRPSTLKRVIRYRAGS